MSVAALTACAGPAPTVAPSPPPPAAAAPASSRPPARLTEGEVRALAELLFMEDRRSLDTARVAVLLNHWSVEVRRRAALAAGRIGDSRASSLLLGALDDSDPVVAADAAFALGVLGDTAAAVVETLAGLARNHTADSLGLEAVAALGKVGTDAARHAIVALIRAGAASPAGGPGPAVREALVTLWRFPGAGQAQESLAPFLESEDADIRWRAAYPLVRARVDTVAPLLIGLARDVDPEVRALALRGLTGAAADSDGVAGEAKQVLREALRDPAAHVRINALNALASHRDGADAAVIAAALTDDDGNVRFAAAQALAGFPGESSATALQRVVEDVNERVGIRAVALTSLAGVDRAAGLRAALQWAGEERWLQRFHAARALAGLDWSDSRGPLSRLAVDPDPRVARAALSAIGRAADTTAAAYALYLGRLGATDPTVRAAAITGIGRRSAPADLAILMDAYAQAAQDSVPDAAIAAVVALGALRRAGVPVENAFFTRFAAPASAEVRREVRRRLGAGWGPDDETRPMRGAAFYENVVRTLVAPTLAGAPEPRLLISTEHGTIEIELAAADAPLTVHNILTLVASGYFESGRDPDARRWHRVVPNFVLQDGDPRGGGSGGPGYTIRDEINRRRYDRGAIGMAISGPDTGGSQFFITHSPQPHLDGGYTIFGRVISGMAVADRIVQDDRITGMEVVRP